MIIYCANQKEGKIFNNLLNNLQPGISNYIDCYTTKLNRKRILNHFDNGNVSCTGSLTNGSTSNMFAGGLRLNGILSCHCRPHCLAQRAGHQVYALVVEHGLIQKFNPA